jgi:hypothetical protein
VGNEDSESIGEPDSALEEVTARPRNWARTIANGGKTGKDQSFAGGQGEFKTGLASRGEPGTELGIARAPTAWGTIFFLLSKLRSFSCASWKRVRIFEEISGVFQDAHFSKMVRIFEHRAHLRQAGPRPSGTRSRVLCRFRVKSCRHLLRPRSLCVVSKRAS